MFVAPASSTCSTRRPSVEYTPTRGLRTGAEVRLVNIEIEREEDGRWIAELLDVPGIVAYGKTWEEAVSRIEKIWRILTQTGSCGATL